MKIITGKAELDIINDEILELPDNARAQISDGYHTFEELYKHRCILWVGFCALANELHPGSVWKSKYHSDGSSYRGWFILGYNTEPGEQLTYHLPYMLWGKCNFAKVLEKSPKFDGHTPDDVIDRILRIIEDVQIK